MRFSERYGYKSVRDLVQLDSIDEPLRNALWSLLKIHVWDHVRHTPGIYGGFYLSRESNAELKTLCDRFWFHFFKRPLDQVPHEWQKVLEQLRSYFFQCEWYEVYDFIEFVANNYKRHRFQDGFTNSCNAVLEREVSAYRFIGGLLTRITEREQLQEIEIALDRVRGPVKTHLRRALELLADRENPDYRNSIKESISAVESLVAKSIGAKEGTLGQLIKKLEGEIGLHPALKASFSSLYGYTSDEDGIRHAILDAENIAFEDAKFFLVVCSAFVNYVDSKVAYNS